MLKPLVKYFNFMPKPVSQICLLTSVRAKQDVDYSRYPTLNEDDLEEHFTRGSGPGGQSVNKTSNCVLLRHIPTNLVVKCHTHRLASKNRKEARKLLLEKLDMHFNGENSVQAQLKALENKKALERKRRQNKLNEMKQKWKEREQYEAKDLKPDEEK
ncbi:probable peptide chain release factor C12orf65, mitochondrial [Glossina fuscipes]|uniref:Probable peptide chain release factor C12orf65, mitochondrial n=1 Tax=Glossina fuscipes TaxID=7396 RepID=A0A9C6DWX5_9MUSC|nr:probable peptide chain release factor C12orf65, mitochondrial [Glossina fuscipes]